MRRPRLLITLTVLLIIGIAAPLTLWYTGQRSALADPDQRLLSGKIHAALQSYQQAAQAAPHEPAISARIGLVYTLRGEPAAAQIALATALADSASGEIYDLVRLTQGALAAQHPGYGDSSQLWEHVRSGSALAAQRDTLMADLLVERGSYAEAESRYRSALLAQPSPAYTSHIHTRLALLRASSDIQTAREELDLARTPPRANLNTTILLADMLLPHQPEIRDTLSAILAAEPQTRPQLLGQLYLELGLYRLAESQFTQVSADGPLGLAAATSLAYTHWLNGDHMAGIQQLQQIVKQHPEEPRARALLALAALSSSDPQAAREQLMIIQQTAPDEPATHLAWGQWYAAQRDYVSAAASYHRALDRAPLAERETYAIYVARFYLDSALEVCTAGLPAAEAAAAGPRPSSAAFSALAQARLACQDPQGSRRAAEQAIAQDAQSPEAHYRLGQALAQLGDRAGAQQALIAAADRDIGGPWQQRAEDQMAVLGMN